MSRCLDFLLTTISAILSETTCLNNPILHQLPLCFSNRKWAGWPRRALLPDVSTSLQLTQLAAEPLGHAHHPRAAPLPVPPLRPLVQDAQGPVPPRLPPRLRQAQDVPGVRHDLQDLLPPQAPRAHAPQVKLSYVSIQILLFTSNLHLGGDDYIV